MCCNYQFCFFIPLKAIDYSIHKDFYDRNRRLSQLRGDDTGNIVDRAILLERKVKQAQVRAFLAGDVIWKDAVHRLWLDEDFHAIYWASVHIDPETEEWLPIPLHYQPADGRFAFHEEKLNFR